MSCLPYFNEHLYARPLFCTRPWFQGDCSFYEGAAYSVVPLYFYPRSYFSTPEFRYSPISREPLNTFMVASSFSPVTFNHGQRDSNYWRYATATMNASAIQALENPKTICNPQGDRELVKSTEISSSEKSRIDEVVLKLLASTDRSDSNTMEQRLSCAGTLACKSKMLNVNNESEHAENIEINKISRGLQVGTSCSISSQSCYLSASELNFPNENFSVFSSSLDGDLEVSHNKQQKISIALEDTNKTDVVNQVCTHLRDNQNDDNRCIDVDDDSQQEYHSAEEQDYMEQCFSSKEVQDSSDFFRVKELANEIGRAEDLFARSSVVDSSCEIPEGNEIPESAQVNKCDQHCAKDSCLHLGDHKREQSVSMFYSIHNEDSFRAEAGERNDSKTCLTRLTGIEEKVKKASLSDVSSINTGLCKKADHSSINALQKSRSLQVLSPGRTDSPHSLISTEDTEVTDFCVHDQSIGSIVAANKHNCTPYLNKIASKNKVNQAVDASSDFRACFTTSRATNVKASVVSRSQNTMITMMNKYRPEEWLSVPHRSVACNTDWSAMNRNVEVTASPVAVADTLETSVGSSTARNGRKSKLEDCVELNNRDSDEIPNRMVPLSQTTSYLPCCCKELLQRAINAEMQLLNINSQKDHQHSWKICKSDLEEKECVSSKVALSECLAEPEGQNSQLCSFLKSTNGKPVESTKEKLHSTLEIRRPVMQGSLSQDIQETSPDADTPSLPVVIHNMSGDETSAPQPSPSSKEEKNDLVESSSLNTQEVNEDWFDAKENLTGMESSINPAGNERKKDQLFSTAEKQIAAEETKKESGETKKESKNFYCVHVAGLSPSVSEVDLWLRFQKYQVSKVSICEYSSNYRYATLGFKAASDAKLAVKEMNEQEIKGKAVKVQLVKSLRESVASNNQNLAKQDIESQRPPYSPESIENKNCNGILKVPPVSVTPKLQPHVSDSTSPSKGPDPSKGSSKSLNPVSDLPNVTRLASGSLEKPLCSLASSVNPSPDIKSSKTSPRNALLEMDKEDVAENFTPQGSVKSSPHLSTTFIPANALNLRSFRKVLKKLEELHPEINRDKILDALVEIKENKGSLSGLALTSIVQMTSSLLKKKYASKLEEKPVTGTHLRNK